MKADEKVNSKPSALTIALGFAIYLIVGVFTSFLFYFALMELISVLRTYPPSTSFHKGGFYGLGGGVMMTILLGTLIWETILEKKFSEKIIKIYPKVFIISFVITLGLPHIVHFSYSHHLKSKGYITCDEMSERWFHDLTVVYVKSDAICEKLIADKAKSEEF